MTSTAVATVYAATLRMLGEAGARDQARQLLEKAVKGPPGPELARAQLELARIYREVGDPRAMNLYADAAKAGSFDAKLESGLLLIDTGNPDGGREQLDMLVKTTTPPPAALLLEAARARALVGEHAGATALLEQANKSGNAPHWKVERERGRIALRTADYTGAARALDSALDGCGDDLETFLLAADTAVVDDKQMAKLADKVRQLVKARLKNKIESEVVLGKLVEFTKPDEAFKAFDEAQALVEKTPNTPQLLKAQVNLGRGIAKYFDHDDQVALPFIELAFTLDPSIYEAYVYYADMKKDKDPQAALAKAELSVKYNPAFVEGIEMVGIVAHKLRNMKLLDEQIRKLGDIEPQGPHLKNLMKLRSQ
jgi:tetratricopeptide (TPR) repeat protein